MAEVPVDFKLNFDEAGAKRITREMERWRALSREIARNLASLRGLGIGGITAGGGANVSGGIGASAVLGGGGAFITSPLGRGIASPGGPSPLATLGAAAYGASMFRPNLMVDKRKFSVRGGIVVHGDTGIGMGTNVAGLITDHSERMNRRYAGKSDDPSKPTPGFFGDIKNIAAGITIFGSLYATFNKLSNAAENAARAIQNMADAEQARGSLTALGPAGTKYLASTPLSSRMNVALRGAAAQFGADFPALRSLATREALQPHLFRIGQLQSPSNRIFRNLTPAQILARISVGAETHGIDLQKGLQAAAQEINKGAAMTDESLGTIARGFGPHITSRNLLGVDRGTLRRLFLPATDPNARQFIDLPLAGGGTMRATRANLPSVVQRAVQGFVSTVGGGAPLFPRAGTGMPFFNENILDFPTTDTGRERITNLLDETAGVTAGGGFWRQLGRDWDNFSQSIDRIILEITMDDETKAHFKAALKGNKSEEFEIPVNERGLKSGVAR